MAPRSGAVGPLCRFCAADLLVAAGPGRRWDDAGRGEPGAAAPATTGGATRTKPSARPGPPHSEPSRRPTPGDACPPHRRPAACGTRPGAAGHAQPEPAGPGHRVQRNVAVTPPAPLRSPDETDKAPAPRDWRKTAQGRPERRNQRPTPAARPATPPAALYPPEPPTAHAGGPGSLIGPGRGDPDAAGTATPGPAPRPLAARGAHVGVFRSGEGVPPAIALASPGGAVRRRRSFDRSSPRLPPAWGSPPAGDEMAGGGRRRPRRRCGAGERQPGAVRPGRPETRHRPKRPAGDEIKINGTSRGNRGSIAGRP